MQILTKLYIDGQAIAGSVDVSVNAVCYGGFALLKKMPDGSYNK